MEEGRGNVEMYSEGRYFIMTGNVYNPAYRKLRIAPSHPGLHSKYIPMFDLQYAREIFRLDMDIPSHRQGWNCKRVHSFSSLSGQWQGVFNSQQKQTSIVQSACLLVSER